MSSKPSIPKGTRDFSPQIMNKRNYLMSKITAIFRKYGFMQLETPAMEQLTTLTGKYGDEGDQLIFRILNSGDFLNKTTADDYNSGSKPFSTKISEKGLRYDLTVPFARHVVMNQNEITFPFRRFQVQPVWRADRPQKGRYREFYQCDADIVGTTSLVCEAELTVLVHEVFESLGIENYSLRINNRKVLNGIAGYLGQPEKATELCTAIDKLDKIGFEGVEKELLNKGFSSVEFQKLSPLLKVEGNNEERLDFLKKEILNETAQDGFNEIREVIDYTKKLGVTENSKLVFDPTLARGLGYYTGVIFEITVDNVSIGSVSGGGRYDSLTGIFGLPNVSGVGISFGIDRLMDVLEALDLFPSGLAQNTKVLITLFSEETKVKVFELLKQLREAGIPSEVYPDLVKMKKQFSYANNKNIPFVLTIGPDEILNKQVALKNMITGEQQNLGESKIVGFLKENIIQTDLS